jgi:5-methylcytosine-specific restriction endonuclease McrA
MNYQEIAARYEARRRYTSYEWKRLRTRLIREARRCCQRCGEYRSSGGYRSRKSPLQIHHTYYLRDKNHKPWDYPDACFQVLCKDCHEATHESTKIPYYDEHPNQYR